MAIDASEAIRNIALYVFNVLSVPETIRLFLLTVVVGQKYVASFGEVLI